MVVKKKTGKDLARTAACALGGAVALFLIVSFLGQYLGFLTFLIVAGVFYLLYQVVIGSNVEYEYSFTNGAMDVDKIIAASRRKRMTALNAREIEMMGTKRNAAFDGYIKNGEIKKVYASADARSRRQTAVLPSLRSPCRYSPGISHRHRL